MLFGTRGLRQPDRDRQDSVAVGDVEVAFVRSWGKRDRADERPICEFRSTIGLPVLAALGPDCQHPVTRGDVDVFCRIDAGQFRPDLVAAVVHPVFEPDQLTAEHWLKRRPRRETT